MGEKKDVGEIGSEPAFPVCGMTSSIVAKGMDIRTYLAGQALVALGTTIAEHDAPYGVAASWAVEQADALLARLQETSDE